MKRSIIPKAIANKLNEYFTNGGPSLAKNIKKSSDTNFEKYLTGNYQNSTFIVHITENELENEIGNMIILISYYNYIMLYNII